mgnify:FL=1
MDSSASDFEVSQKNRVNSRATVYATRKRKNPEEAREKENTKSSKRTRRTTEPPTLDGNNLDFSEVNKNSFFYPEESVTLINKWKKDQSFLQHQTSLLKTPFEIEDCRELSLKEGLCLIQNYKIFWIVRAF